ncbi:internalin [Bifidobacterium ramosum]|nr:S-layer homology domain-containing protein [Bifidobacterium ramosum]KAB8288611.1 internalin [Bifidobacterium ramosum]
MKKRTLRVAVALLVGMLTVHVPFAYADTAETAPASAVTFVYGTPSGPWYRDVRIGSASADDNAGGDTDGRLSAEDDAMVPSVAVTAHGLDAGVTYCANLNQFSDPRTYYSDGYDGSCAVADATGSAVFRIRLVAGTTDWETLSPYVHDGVIQLYAHVARKDGIVNGIAAPVASDMAGVSVPVASVSDLVTLAEPRLSVTDGVVTVRYDYRVHTALAKVVAGSCIAFDAFRMTDLMVTDKTNAQYLYLDTVDPLTNETAYCGGTDDADATSVTVSADTGKGSVTSVEPRTSETLPVADYRYRRLWVASHPSVVADGGNHMVSDSVQVTDTAAVADSRGTTVENAVRTVIRANRGVANEPLASVRASLQFRFRDGSYVALPFVAVTTDISQVADESLGKCTASFDDVTAATPHADDIRWLSCRGIAAGWTDAATGAAVFRGMSPVKRQDMAAFLYRLAGSPLFDETKADNPFVDVDDGTPHCKEVLWLAAAGIAEGWTEDDGSRTFRGDATVKRQDMAAFLRRFATYMGANPSLGNGMTFADVDAQTPHAEDIVWLARAGITTGWLTKNGAHEFRGGSMILRQDMAAFLRRVGSGV